MHELFHKLGLWHEHYRYDRDGFITIRFDRIERSIFLICNKKDDKNNYIMKLSNFYDSEMNAINLKFCFRKLALFFCAEQKYD